MLGIFVIILTIILAFVCLLISLVVLMQRPKQEGLGAAFGGALTDRVLGSGTTDFLQKATVYLGVMFFIFSLGIATLTARIQNEDRQALVPEVETPETPAADEVPMGELPGVEAEDSPIPEPPIDDFPVMPTPEVDVAPDAGEPSEGEDAQPAPDDAEQPAVEVDPSATEETEQPSAGDGQPEAEEVPVPSAEESAPAEPEPSEDDS